MSRMENNGSTVVIEKVPEKETGSKIVKNEGSNKYLFLCAIAANMSSMCAGAIIAWSSPAQARLAGDNPPYIVTEDQAAWVTGVTPLCGIVGPFIAGYCADRFGRQKSLMYVTCPLVISWIILASTDILALVYIARLLAGLSVGWIFTILPMYTGEISTDDVRGALGSFFQIFLSLGVLYIYAVAPYVSWMWLQIIGLTTPLIFGLSFMLMPESPYFYAIVNDKESGIKALQSLRHKPAECVEEEYQQIKNEVDESFKNSTSFRDLWSTKANIKAVVISLGMVGFQLLSGIDVILMYSESVFTQASGKNSDHSLSPEVSTIIVGFVELVASFVTPFVVDRWGRRFLLLLSAVMMGACQIIIGVYFHFQKTGEDVSGVSFLPILCVIVFVIAFSIGFGSVAWAVVGELFAPNIKSKAATLCASFSWFIAFIIIQFYPSLNKAIGPDGSFWMFGGLCAAAFVFTFILLPETKGRSLVEIQNILSK